LKTLNFCNHGLQICKEGVLFWLEKEIAIVSDLHLEKGSSYASSGQYIPPYDSEETLLKLLDILNNYRVKKVILLGDTFHDKDAFLRMTSKVRFLFEDFTKKYEVIFILGNHENKIKIEGIKFHQEYIVDDIHFLHEAIQKNINQISGHFHPVASIKVSSKKITSKCLIHSNNHIILPSFGEFTGGLNINDPVLKPFISGDYNIYFLTKKSIYKFSNKEIESQY
jgi:DNA ligase-associated metallophosphoesterase